MEIREAKPSDALGIARVRVDSWRTTYRGIIAQEYLDALSYKAKEEQWAGILTDAESEGTEGKRFTLVAEEENKVIGFASGGEERSGDQVYRGELYAIYLLREWQRKGIGRLLFEKSVQILIRDGFDSILVWVLSKNPSRSFYESLGGALVRTRPITIGGTVFEEAAYGWLDIKNIPNSSNPLERRTCPVCMRETEIEFVRKPDVDLKICKNCGAAIAILYKDDI